MADDRRNPTLTAIGGTDIDRLHPHLLKLYAACFAGPPWNETGADVTAYGDRIRDWAAVDSFTGFVAHGSDGGLVGAAYGWNGPPVAHGVPLPGVTAKLPFHVADLMVDPAARRQGLGRSLLDRLVDGRRPALLLTHPESVSCRLYESAGWRATGLVELPKPPVFRVYTLD